MGNNRQTPVLFGLATLRTELGKRGHDRHAKQCVLLRAHQRDAQADLDAWKRETSNVTKTEGK
jgi:hypothetical protein